MDEEKLSDKDCIVSFLRENGCCSRCASRYVGEYTYQEKDPDRMVDSEGKRMKKNPCVACLDLLQDYILDSMVLHSDLDKVREYDCEDFTNYITFPTAVIIREHSLEVSVKTDFPAYYKDHYIIPLNKAWSAYVRRRLSSAINKKANSSSLLQIHFTGTYDNEQMETTKLLPFADKVNGHKDLSRNAVVELLRDLPDDLFKKCIAIPPDIPSSCIWIDKATVKHEAIYIAGRYCKYSRKLFQTPWSSDGPEKEVFTDSVERIIVDALGDTFKCEKMVFSASGREDFDVRCLGRGRPFYIKIVDPKVTKVPFETFRSAEKTVNDNESKLISVHDLQFIDKKQVNQIKEGEQFKKKTYRAVCLVDNAENLTKHINSINKLSSLVIHQKTPLRVYHRRSSDCRQKYIYSIKAKAIEGRDKMFELDLVTQAGTYVKEFVHGDFGRTEPSVAAMLDSDVDILALDVLDIDLDFPPSIGKS